MSHQFQHFINPPQNETEHSEAPVAIPPSILKLLGVGRAKHRAVPTQAPPPLPRRKPRNANWQALSRAVELLYRHAHGGDPWGPSLGVLAESLSADHGILIVTRDGVPVDLQHGEPAGVTIEAEQLLRRLSQLSIAPGFSRETPVVHNDILTAGIDSSEPYAELLCSSGIGHLLGFDIASDHGVVHCFRFSRSLTAFGFSTKEQGIAVALRLHIKNALDIRCKLAFLDATQAALERVANRLDTATILLDSQCGFLTSNDHARSFMQEHPEIRISGRRISMQEPENERKWNNLLQAARSRPKGQLQGQTVGAMAIQDSTGTTFLGLVLRSIPRKRPPGPSEPAFVIYLRDA